MALKKIITLPSDVPVEYCKIKSVTIDTTIPATEVIVETYFNKSARDNGKPPISEGRYSKIFKPVVDEKTEISTYGFDLELLESKGNNPIKQAYNELKKLEKFKGATDV